MPSSDPTTAPAVNLDVAERFREAADLLEAQDASPFRVRAYRQGASTLTQLDRSVETIYEEEGREGLEALPNIGSALTNAIVETLRTGQWRFLERLRGRVTPESVFRQVAGIGPELAERIHDALDIDTLEELEQAAHDGRLAEVEGIGERRLQAVRESVASRLRRIAPHRFNPEGEAWLPILHTDRDGRHYTALYSNTARAHTDPYGFSVGSH